MTIFNCTSETTGHILTKNTSLLPSSIRKECKEIVSTCSTNPVKKAEMFAKLLNNAGILPQDNNEFYIGRGKSKTSGYSNFRTELRKLGYIPLTRLKFKKKEQTTDSVYINVSIAEIINRYLKITNNHRIVLKTSKLSCTNDVVFITDDLTVEYTLSNPGKKYVPPTPPILRNGVLMANHLGKEYLLTFLNGSLKYITPNFKADGFQHELETNGIIEFLSSDTAIYHRFGDIGYIASLCLIQLHISNQESI